jgi:signal transduction histidine kinase
MRAKNFCSPFFILLFLLVLNACRDGKQSSIDASKDAEFVRLVSEARSAPTSEDGLEKAYLALRRATSRDDSRIVGHSIDSISRTISEKYPDSAKPLLFRYRQESQKFRDTVNLAYAYLGLGQFHQKQDALDSAFQYFDRSRLLSAQLGDSLSIAYKLLLIGDIYLRFNDYIELENSATEVFRYLKAPYGTFNDSAYAFSAYSYCGLAYTNQYNFDAALSAYQKALQLSQDPLNRSVVANNIAYTYMESKDFPKAIGVLLPLLRIDAVTAEPQIHARILDNLGYSYFRVGGAPAKSEQLLLRSARIRDSIGDTFGAIPSYIHLSEFYNDNTQKARGYALRAYRLATGLHSADDRIFALDRLRICVSGQERDHYSTVMINLKDSITKVRQVAKNQFAKIRYDSSQANAENLKLKSESSEKAFELERRRRWNDLLLFGIVIMILLSVTIYVLTRKRFIAEKVQEGYRTESRIAKKLHDELANDMFNMIAFAESQDLSDSGKRESLLSSLDDVYARTRDISRENSQVETGETFPARLREMLSEYNRPGLNIITQGLDDISWNQLSEMKKLTVWRVLQELMVNMKKHSAATLTAIRFSNEPKKIGIDYSDNGVGISCEKNVLKNGLQNVENRIEAIGGTITFDSVPDRGLKIAIKIPV